MKPDLRKSSIRWAGGLIAAVGLLGMMPGARADEPVTMAPPVSDSQPLTTQTVDGTPVNTSQNSVFNWAEIPQDQRVPLTRAAFDQGGYQLYDTVGETIVVPFADKNLYVMKFAASPDDTMFFVNTGGAPVLYVPQNGYLQNATVPGAKWYPFSEKFHPAEPVFVGIAPSYPVFVNLGWYPDTVLYGGYYGRRSFVEGGIFLPSIGLTFFLGGRPYYGYTGYHNYLYEHPAPYHIGYFHRDVYRFAGRPIGPGHAFYGGGRGTFEGRGGEHSFTSGGFRGDHQTIAGGSHSFGGGGHVFRGGGTLGSGGHSYAGSHSSGDHSFSDNRDRSVSGSGSPMYAHRTFQGGGGSLSSGSESHTSGGNRSTDGGRSFGGSSRSSDDGRPSSSHSFDNGSHTRGNDHADKGSRSSEGDHSSSGGGGRRGR